MQWEKTWKKFGHGHRFWLWERGLTTFIFLISHDIVWCFGVQLIIFYLVELARLRMCSLVGLHPYKLSFSQCKHVPNPMQVCDETPISKVYYILGLPRNRLVCSGFFVCLLPLNYMVKREPSHSVKLWTASWLSGRKVVKFSMSCGFNSVWWCGAKT